MGLNYEMRARVKSAYSIWNKMESKGVSFEDIYDIYAVRIIFDPLPGVDEKNQCWDIYSAITDIYRIRPDRIRDWVSRPKANGYQALHLTVMDLTGNGWKYRSAAAVWTRLPRKALPPIGSIRSII